MEIFFIDGPLAGFGTLELLELNQHNRAFAPAAGPGWTLASKGVSSKDRACAAKPSGAVSPGAIGSIGDRCLMPGTPSLPRDLASGAPRMPC